MTTSGPMRTYRYVADGRLAPHLHREAVTRLLAPVPVVTLVLGGLVLGVGLSFAWRTASLPRQLGWVLLFGVVFGLVFIFVATVVVACVALPLAMVVNRRMMARLYPVGSATDVEVVDDALVLRRPTGTREVRYGRIFRVRPRGSFLLVEIRGRLTGELLPLGLLPDDAVDFIRTRARGAWPTESLPSDVTPTRQMVVPSGWAAHVAAVHTRDAVRHRGFWIRVGLWALFAALLAFVAGQAWLLIAPLAVLLVLLVTYVQARRAIAIVQPTGSVATTHFFEDRFVSRNAGGVREIRFDDIVSLGVRRDVVLLDLASYGSTMLIARALIPADALERLRRWALNRRRRAGG